MFIYRGVDSVHLDRFSDHCAYRSDLLVATNCGAATFDLQNNFLNRKLWRWTPSLSTTIQTMLQQPLKMLILDSIDDLRLSPYRNLKDRELARLGGRFIAESDLIVRRLLASHFLTESVLVASRKAEALAPAVTPHVPLYVLPDAMLNAVIGFPFHTGVLAVGLREPSAKLTMVLPPNQEKSTVVILPEITNAENLGSLIRISSAFGADAIILGPRCCDPFYRMSIRVSMGTIFSIPIVRSENLIDDLAALRNDHGFDLVAAVLDTDAENLDHAARHFRQAILFGNEATGLNPPEISACTRRVTLPMSRLTDSLNVAVAAGVFLYHFTRE